MNKKKLIILFITLSIFCFFFIFIITVHSIIKLKPYDRIAKEYIVSSSEIKEEVGEFKYTNKSLKFENKGKEKIKYYNIARIKDDKKFIVEITFIKNKKQYTVKSYKILEGKNEI